MSALVPHFVGQFASDSEVNTFIRTMGVRLRGFGSGGYVVTRVEGLAYWNIPSGTLRVWLGDEMTGAWTVAGGGGGGGGDYLEAAAAGQTEGPRSLAGLSSLMLIKSIEITTLATDWTFTIYSRNDYATGERVLLKNRDGSLALSPDLPYEDESGVDSLHYRWVDNAGAGTYDIEVTATSLA